jgi:outer membrane protein assembly factor BamD (BamD/ComL family)
MTSDVKRPLKVFLCHASFDKPAVRALYQRLVAEGVDAWLDQEKLLPGQDWQVEIPRAVHDADVVVICLSKNSVTKEGYVQKEIKFALDLADEKPEGTIFLIPARLEVCDLPTRLGRWQWVDLFENDGFIRLLRSLKLRADKVDAAIEPVSYVDADKERGRRLEQFYTEGLAAFYTEDWDQAYRHFQTILSEQPNHKNAAEKLAEAERQRNQAKLYAQSVDAYQVENWQAAIKTLEELFQKAADYKDAGQLLKNARKQKQLKELYAEAKTLHAAQKWEAVLKVFEQITAVDPAYLDADGLLPSAQKEVAEIKRIAGLNDLYSRALREMETGQWFNARGLLEQVHKAQTGFLETERLLRKAEDEIVKIEEQNKRANQVNVLYEQAHGLVRSKSWRKALDKMEEIQKLDDRFVDKDGIVQKAKGELEREEQEAQKQNQLAAMYADAVRLVKEEKFQEALEEWQEIKAIDSKYPDRQGVQATARRKLQGIPQPVARPERTVSSFKFLNSLSVEWVLLLAFLAIVVERILYGIINQLFPIDWVPPASVFPPFFNLFVIGGFYGAVVALALGRVIQNWRIWHVTTVILGWALGWGLLIPMGRWGWNFLVQNNFNFILSSLSIAVAIKWADRRFSWLKTILIFICWAAIWKMGDVIVVPIKDAFGSDYIMCAIESMTTLFGLLMVFGIYENSSKKLIWLTMLSMLGFMIGSMAGGLSELLSSDPLLSALVSLAIWGVVGGITFELSSRNWKMILLKGGICGLGLSLGYVASLIIPIELHFTGPYLILKNIIWGAGLGLACCLPSRRISAIGLITILGSFTFVITSSLNQTVFSEWGTLWQNIIRGGLIGLVLGFGYAYVTRENKNQSSS